MKSTRLVLLVSSTLVLALSATALAGAANAATFTPKTGMYSGTLTTATGTSKISGQVGKEGKKYIVQVLASTTATCADGSLVPAGVGIPAKLQGKSFSATESGKDSRSGGTATWTISGHFSSEKAFTGTAKKEISAGPLLPEQGACSTGTVKFSLTRK